MQYRKNNLQNKTGADEPRSVLASLRGVVPQRTVTFAEALRVAELQAARLRELTGTESDDMPEAVLLELPRLQVLRRHLPTSGVSYWDSHARQWVIAVNSSEPEVRQRFTLFHEYKHVIDHGRTRQFYTGVPDRTPEQQAEQAADYFAGCVLMPKRLFKRAWGNGIQTPAKLAALFNVSERAAEVRLAQLGLTDPTVRCAPPSRSSGRPRLGRYYRIGSVNPTLGRAA